MPKNDQDKKRIFLSFHESSEKSRKIVNQFKVFFESWEIEGIVIEQSESTDPPEEKIIQEIRNSDYLIQVYTDRWMPSEWMKFEWDAAKICMLGDNRLKNLIVVYTDDTNLDDPSFKMIKDRMRAGQLNTVNINKRSQAKRLLEGILVETKRLNVSHGEIELPECCGQASPDKIGWNDLERFIRNFRKGHNKGLETVYPDRKEAQKDLEEKIQSLKKNDEIKMLGFTLRRYVDPRHKKGIGKKFEAAIIKGAKAQLLLLDLKCQAAKQRAKIESPNVEIKESLLYTDGDAVRKYWKYNKVVKENLEIREYQSPYIGLVLLNDTIYVELYHLGRQIEDKNICGHVPILVFRSKSVFYELFEQHFNTLWNGSKKIH